MIADVGLLRDVALTLEALVESLRDTLASHAAPRPDGGPARAAQELHLSSQPSGRRSGSRRRLTWRRKRTVTGPNSPDTVWPSYTKLVG